MTKSALRPIDTVRADLEKMKPQFAMALPKHLTPDRLLRVAITCVQNTPKLLKCDKASLYSAIMTCAQLGLEPDGVLGQAYLVPFSCNVKDEKGNWTKVDKVQFIPGYKGLLALARNSGEVISISSHEVCENDEFEYEYGINEKLRHVPAKGERGEITYFYACAKFKGEGYHFEVMTREQIDKIRDNSQGYKASKANKKESVWDTNYIEMGRKTAIRRIAKYLPLNVQRAVAFEDAAERGQSLKFDEHGEGLIIEGEYTAEDDDSSKLKEIVSREEELLKEGNSIVNTLFIVISNESKRFPEDITPKDLSNHLMNVDACKEFKEANATVLDTIIAITKAKNPNLAANIERQLNT